MRNSLLGLIVNTPVHYLSNLDELYVKYVFFPPLIQLVEFDLRSVHYEVKSARCHEMRLTTPPHDFIRFSFRCDREAEEWATVVMSSLREAQRGGFFTFFVCDVGTDGRCE